MTPYRCIGKYRSRNGGQLAECQNYSDVPSLSDHPEWGYLCPDCSQGYANSSFQVELPDLDPPSFDDDGIEAYPERPSQDEQDLADLDALQELDLD